VLTCGRQPGRGQPRGVGHHRHRPAQRDRSRCECRTAGLALGAAAGPGGNGDHGLSWAELSTHLSFPEIAAEMFLSRTTIKSDALSPYRKLGPPHAARQSPCPMS